MAEQFRGERRGDERLAVLRSPTLVTTWTSRPDPRHTVLLSTDLRSIGRALAEGAAGVIARDLEVFPALHAVERGLTVRGRFDPVDLGIAPSDAFVLALRSMSYSYFDIAPIVGYSERQLRRRFQRLAEKTGLARSELLAVGRILFLGEAEATQL